MRLLIAILVMGAVLQRSTPAADLRHFDDAALHAVQFVDDKEGWGVGDDGVIWHTIDGGGRWERQPSGVRASLRSVQFLDPYMGWIAGREELPLGQGSVGVLLFTRDGGLKWHRAAVNALPGLHCIRFVNATTGFAAGDGTEQYPSGLFRTQDAGQSWHPVPGKRTPGWLAAEFPSERQGALVGAWSRFAALRQGSLTTADVDNLSNRHVLGLHMNGQRAVAVAQGGVVLLSSTEGQRWGLAELQLPTEVLACCDFHAVHGVGEHIWIAGRPGSALLHSADRGQSWSIERTGQPLPLNGLFFINAQRGWAVGELGSILATADGGKTWRVQHRGGQRAAILFVHGRPENVPLDTVALVGGEDGYLATAVQVLASDASAGALHQAREPQRLAAALRKTGGAAAETLWQFPLPQHLARASANDLLQAWNNRHADRATEELLRQLVLALRIWRPSVVVTDSASEGACGADVLLAAVLKESLVKAADPLVFPEQIQLLGLEPWKVAKLYGREENPANAHVVLDLTKASPYFETAINDQAAKALCLVTESPAPLPNQRGYRLLSSSLAGAVTHRNLMQGAELAPGGVARRKLMEALALSPEKERAIRTRRHLQALVEQAPSNLADPNKLLAQIGPLLSTLPSDQGAVAALALANHYARTGQWTLAQELFSLLVERYPAEPVAADAYRWLIRHNASGEARRRQELGQFWLLTQETVRVANETWEPSSQMRVQLPEGVATRQAGLLINRDDTKKWYQGSLEMGKRLAAQAPLCATEPSIQFCLQAAQRRLGNFEAAREWYARFHREHVDGPWREAAGAELWLMTRTGQPAKPVIYCRQTNARPVLDGELNDGCWRELKPVMLRNAVAETTQDSPTEVFLTYDKDFLYLGLRCQHPADRYTPLVKNRAPDADLRSFDRVSLLLDIDRDYATYFQLEVDQRGCVRDDCWGDASWNPRWFVAAKSDAAGWQIEAALPLSQLSSDAITVGRTWACNMVRVLPGRGVQAWSLPADAQPRPEGMGLLMFMQEPTAGERKPASARP